MANKSIFLRWAYVPEKANLHSLYAAVVSVASSLFQNSGDLLS